MDRRTDELQSRKHYVSGQPLIRRTVLRAAAEQVEYVSVSADDFHHLHLLNQVGDVTVATVVCNSSRRQIMHKIGYTLDRRAVLKDVRSQSHHLPYDTIAYHYRTNANI